MLWREVLARYEMDEHETALLREAVRTLSQLDALDAAVRVDGVLVAGKAHPALVEARQQRVVLARLIASLRLPEDDAGARPQRRGAARGSYDRRVHGLTVAS